MADGMQVGQLWLTLGIEDLTRRDLTRIAQTGSSWERANGLTIQVGAEDQTQEGLASATGKVEAARSDAARPFTLDADAQAVKVAADAATGFVEAARSDAERTMTLDADPGKVRTGAGQAEDALDKMRRTGETPVEPTVDTSKVDDGAAEGQSSLVGMIGGWEVAATAAGAALATAVGLKFVDAFQEAIDVRAGRDVQLTASLGLSPDEAAVAGRIAGELYAQNYGDSTTEVNSTLREALLLQQQLGQRVAEDGSTVVAGFYGNSAEAFGRATADVEQLTIDALTMAKVFGVDATRAVQIMGNMIHTGLAKDGREAADILVAGLQQVPAELTGDVLDALDEYSKHFATLGITGPEAMGMLVRASQGGAIELDKVGDSLKELTIRGTDMSKTSTDAYHAIGLDAQEMSDALLAGGDISKRALDLIVTGLLGIKDPSDRANAAIALFGTPLEDMAVDKIPAFLQGLRNGGGGLGDFAGAAGEAGTQLNDNLATKIDGVIRMLSPASLLDAFDQGGIELVKQRIQEGVDQMRAIWEQYGPAVKELITAAIDGIAAEWEEHGPEMTERVKTWWKEDAQPVIEEAIGEALREAWDAARDALARRMGDPEWWMTTVKDEILQPFKVATGLTEGEMIDALLNWFVKVPGEVVRRASGMWDGIGEAFESMINGIIDVWNGLEFKVPGFDAFGQHFGGFTLGMPDLGHVRFGGGAAGGLGGAAAAAFDGYRAKGGPVDPYKAYIVGEKGPELFMASGSGVILPADITAGIVQNGKPWSGLGITGGVTDMAGMYSMNAHYGTVGPSGPTAPHPFDASSLAGLMAWDLSQLMPGRVAMSDVVRAAGQYIGNVPGRPGAGPLGAMNYQGHAAGAGKRGALVHVEHVHEGVGLQRVQQLAEHLDRTAVA